jgi:hypothetical protein
MNLVRVLRRRVPRVAGMVATHHATYFFGTNKDALRGIRRVISD